MANKMVKISVSQVLIIKVSPTDIIDGLPVNHKGTMVVWMLRVIGLKSSYRNLGGRGREEDVNRELL